MLRIDRATKILTMDFNFMQVAAEIPYMVIQPLIFSAIVYPMVGFQLAVKKFFLFVLYMILIFMDYTLYGMMAVALTPTAEIATGLSLTIFVVWNFFSGFIVTVKVIASLEYQIFDRTSVSLYTSISLYRQCRCGGGGCTGPVLQHGPYMALCPRNLVTIRN